MRRSLMMLAVILTGLTFGLLPVAGHADAAPARTASAATCSPDKLNGRTVGMATTPDGDGYWIAASTGQVAACGDARALGNGVAGTVAIAAAPSGDGYWLVTAGGGVYSFGTAKQHGGLTSLHLTKPIVAMAADPSTGGYWLLGADGGVFSFDAPFYGSTGNIKLNKPAVGMVANPRGTGYYFVASDGGVFTYGKAKFYGSTGSLVLNKPIVGMAIDPTTGGYWLDASDGGIFSFYAPFYGSTGNLKLAKPCVGMSAMPNGRGYRFVAADGGIFDFGAAPFEGSAATSTSVAPPTATKSCSVTLSNYAPSDNSDITADIRSNAPDTAVTLKKAYKTVTSYNYATTDSAGNASIVFNDGSATFGYTVAVSVTVGPAQCSTSFTPS